MSKSMLVTLSDSTNEQLRHGAYKNITSKKRIAETILNYVMANEQMLEFILKEKSQPIENVDINFTQ